MKPSFALASALLLIATMAAAETHVPAGPVSGTWTTLGSPYIIEGNIIVEATASLTLQPGVTVIQNPYCRFKIEGQLLALGTPADSIHFQAADITIGSEGLHFVNTNLSSQDSSKLEYCELSHGIASPPPDPFQHGGGIYIKNSSRLRISHSFIHHCSTLNVVGANGADGQFGTSNGQPGQPGATVESGKGGGIYIEDSSPLITFCGIAHNHTGTATGGNGGKGGDAMNFNGNAYGGAGGAGGNGTSGKGGGICLSNSNAVLVGNELTGNYTGLGHGGKGGIGGNAYADYAYAQGGAGGIGGQGNAGLGGAICSMTSNADMIDNICYSNHIESGTGGTGGNGGSAGVAPMVPGPPGAGGGGGDGHGGNGYALYTNGGTNTVNGCTFTQHQQISQGIGGAGGWNGNNTIQASAGQGFNGLEVISCSTLGMINSIIWNNATTSLCSSATVTYSDIQGSFPGQGNISSDPLFVAGPGGAYYLSQIAAGQTVNSPCLDAGNPASAMIIGTTRTDQVQDNGILDIGYHYPMGLALNTLEVTLMPVNPPIVVPAQGGSFQFTASVINHGPAQTPFYAFSKIYGPSGQLLWGGWFYAVQVNPPVGMLVSRLRTQNVPGTWPAGQYLYGGYVGLNYGGAIADSDYFYFTKSATADGEPWVTEASCWGEPFPYEVGAMRSAASTSGSGPKERLCSATPKMGISPNPFNPATAISYQLQATGQVSLWVYDVSGRMIATLVDGMQEAGQHRVIFDGSKLASGLYFVKMKAGSYTAVQKMMLLK